MPFFVPYLSSNLSVNFVSSAFKTNPKSDRSGLSHHYLSPGLLKEAPIGLPTFILTPYNLFRMSVLFRVRSCHSSQNPLMYPYVIQKRSQSLSNDDKVLRCIWMISWSHDLLLSSCFLLFPEHTKHATTPQVTFCLLYPWFLFVALTTTCRNLFPLDCGPREGKVLVCFIYWYVPRSSNSRTLH